MGLKVGLAALLGVLVVIGLVVHHGATEIGMALVNVGGWGIAWISLLHTLPLICSAFAWQILSQRLWPGSFGIFLAARSVREAVNTLLPVAQIGGEFIGARILTHGGAMASVAAASVIVDLSLEITTQFVFTVLCLTLLWWSGHHPGTVQAIAGGLAIALPLLLGFILAQRWGLFRWLEQGLSRFLANTRGLNDAIQSLYQNLPSLAWGSFWHLLSWFLISLEVWLALYLMGHPLTVEQALILFGFAHAVRSAAFVVPSGLGAQEAGFMLLGGLYGLSPEVTLALSLTLRVREILLGAPVLVAWQVLEGRRIWLDRFIATRARSPDQEK